jgi:hypothetical protein
MECTSGYLAPLSASSSSARELADPIISLSLSLDLSLSLSHHKEKET